MVSEMMEPRYEPSQKVFDAVFNKDFHYFIDILINTIEEKDKDSKEKYRKLMERQTNMYKRLSAIKWNHEGLMILCAVTALCQLIEQQGDAFFEDIKSIRSELSENNNTKR
jgi:lipopolysaccharide/colanic/teichoic acid biosynthesis glycosyltransferase